MKRVVLGMRIVLLIAVLVMLYQFYSTLQRPRVGFALEKATATARHTRRQAIDLARGATGLGGGTVKRAEYGLLSYPDNPVFTLQRQPVWQVIFDNVTLSLPLPQGTKAVNPYIHTFAVVLDDQTGAPLLVASPTPRKGGLSEQMRGAWARGRLAADGLTFAPASTAPSLPLLSALAAAQGSAADFVPPAEKARYLPAATEIVAYYGLLTDTSYKLSQQRPTWLVYAGGLMVSLSHRGGATRFTDARAAVDATTGASAAVLDAQSSKATVK